MLLFLQSQEWFSSSDGLLIHAYLPSQRHWLRDSVVNGCPTLLTHSVTKLRWEAATYAPLRPQTLTTCQTACTQGVTTRTGLECLSGLGKPAFDYAVTSLDNIQQPRVKCTVSLRTVLLCLSATSLVFATTPTTMVYWQSLSASS